MNRNTKPIPFFRPRMGRAERAAVQRVLKSRWLTTGPEAACFESEFTAVLESESPGDSNSIRALAVSSATAGLHLALEAVGVGAGDRVAVPSLTFTSTAGVVRHLGADPVFIDSEPLSGNMDPRKLDEALPGLKAVIPVHYTGFPCDIRSIREVVADSGAKIVEDAAHAFPSATPDGMAGTLGDIGVFSFYATKPITTGEGGMVVTRNSHYAQRMRAMRLHGIDRDVWNRYRPGAPGRSWEYDILGPGYKYNMPDLAAAIGRAQLRKAKEFLNKRRKLVGLYNDGLAGLDGVTLPMDAPGHAWHLYVILLDSPERREKLLERLHAERIGASVHFIPLHQMSYWQQTCKLSVQDFPVAESWGRRAVSLPLWPDMGLRKLNRVVAVIRDLLNGR